jgi:hypothetical protein
MLTSRASLAIGVAVMALGFAIFMVTLPRLQESQTLLRQLAVALDPQAAKDAARLRQQYDASLAIMVAGLMAVVYGVSARMGRSR